MHLLLVAIVINLPVAEPPDFAREVRPILSQYCFKCHGPDDAARKARLRLDDRSVAVERGAIVPEQPAESELVYRLHLPDDDESRMPPPATKMTLTKQQKSILERWIAAGAKYQSHWAFVAPQKPALPDLKSLAREVLNAIDLFVQARLQREGLTPSPPADRHTLVRRVYLDLIGLPPTPDEVLAFVNDTSPGAYERLVEKLLASPHYGERWARRWLDLARYADTNGYEKDRIRSIWPYRDWVIRAFNADMPFDQFTIEQLAGDLLPNATPEQRIATGFHRNTMLNEEGGIDPLEFRFHALTDRVATTGTAWLGLTTGCAQCHTHKFDPITIREYYQLFAFLNNADEPELAITTPELKAKREAIQKQIDALTASLSEQFPKEVDPERAFANWLERERDQAIRWDVVRPKVLNSNLPLLRLQDDGSIFASGDFTKSDEYRLRFERDFTGVTAIRIEALPDERLPRGGPGATYYEGPIGDFTLSEITATVGKHKQPFASASHSFAAGKFTAAAAIDGNPQTGWSVTGRTGERHVAVFLFEKPLPMGDSLELSLLFERHYAAALGRFRVSVTKSPRAMASAHPPEVETALLIPAEELSTAPRALLYERFLQTTVHLADARKKIDELRKQLPALPTTLVLQEREPDHPRPTFVHHRGEFLQPKEEVNPGVPAFLPPLPEGVPANRLGFARWIVSRNNPLTARVTVNRHWQAFFGRGLVRTTEDFGYQGEMPSHPDLLDWLAVEFMDRGWSVKQLHRLIVTSTTYRQSSVHRPHLLERDPENVLLARGPRVRLEAELIRDALLRTSGQLTPTLFGPPVYPPQPGHITTEGTYGAMPWPTSTGPDRTRRSLYTFAKRTAPFALFATFDAPSGEACVARRELSNTPLQALSLLNDQIVLEAAQALGRDYADRKENDRERIRALVLQVLTRTATDSEVSLFTDFLEKQRQTFANDPKSAREFAGPGEGNISERAAWTALARVLFNLDEFVTKG